MSDYTFFALLCDGPHFEAQKTARALDLFLKPDLGPKASFIVGLAKQT